MDIENVSFEENLEKVKKITENLESNELSLEDSLKKFKEGMDLIKICQKKLETAEIEIQTILKNNDEIFTDKLEDFN